ncbi:phosphoenolpyruvate carboxykinase [Levilactobacillus namurensis]|uniref:phosphoenolpyruvate carboxykinase n=1 Tax=Levilactobacillus namurensis TaxID=380393 RepID=UPI00222E6B22|nr:phosphoenolpyruvate carboxykinase [Levilactobacillus namurensis]MCW3778287.1 phosphoenolpyruvate carboxykinase [Levilactobacillus namurensis]MDT7019255.1 phosphoenolpyruvate carboxykinase [Levilactobacillus namurensis]WNN66143.1 phosphoenolpyruvate carboxykinase [Levilactobacillus namurensis]
MTEPAAIDLPAFYANPDRSVAVLNYNARFITSIFDLVNSDELAAFIKLFLDEQQTRVPEDADPATTFNRVDATTYVATLKGILTNQPNVYDRYPAAEILASIEDLYSYYRSYLRVATMSTQHNDVVSAEFMTIDQHFNELVIRLYRTIEEKLQGHANHVYRQTSAASSACVLLQKLAWPMPAGYEALGNIRFLTRLMLRPPMMLHTKSNKRKGRFTASQVNPLTNFTGDARDWYCYPAKIGTSLAYLYFHRDYLASGLALANLFQLADESEVTGKKPDLILLFGSPSAQGDTDPENGHYYYDAANQLYVGQVPYNDQTTYFGYMKKICLTLHNLHQIDQGRLPIHGSMVKITFANGVEKTVVFFGDSGAGKSESIEALQTVADEKIANIETIFDDMGSFTLQPGGQGIYAQGTETGAFVRLDDLSSEVAFNNMDRGIYMNPEQKNARVIIPANTWKRVVAHHEIDMWVYANNYDDAVGIHQFTDQAAAKATFIAGKRKALGTTDEVGMSTTFFANPFGPVQEEAATRPIIDAVFDQLFKDQVYVGEIYTHLGNDKSQDKLNESAKELLDVLMHH